MNQISPGYSYEGTTRGAQRELTPIEQRQLQMMQHAANLVLGGRVQRVSFGILGTAELGYDPVEEVRDEFWHQFGMLAGVDIDGLLTENEKERRICLDEEKIKVLGLPKEYFNRRYVGVKRSIALNLKGGATQIHIQEEEFPNYAIREDGTVGSRYSRIYTFARFTKSEDVQ